MKNLTLFSFFIGIIGIILLGMNLLCVLYGPSTSYIFLGNIAALFYRTTGHLPFLVRIILEGIVGYSFVIFFFLSPVGIFLGIKSLNSPKRKLAIFSIILNSINLLLSLFIAWALFGLARGM